MRVLAVDMGATSIRVAAVDLAADDPAVEIVHRWPHRPVEHDDGSLRWDWDGIVAAVEEGLEHATTTGPEVASIGVDGWAVDYGLLDEHGQLVSPPYSYRDARTRCYRDVADAVGRSRLYRLTGTQLMPINTLFQLAAHDRSELERARTLLLLPDLLLHRLTGTLGTERSNASTTAMLDASTGDWCDELLEVAGIEREQLAPLRRAGHSVGEWRGIPVHTVGSHDTASAFIGVPGVPGPGTAIVSSGTWVLVGLERSAPLITDATERANLSNEGGALGGVRLLKNVTGFWMLERCREGWGGPPIESLLEEAERAAPPDELVDGTDPRFLAPDDMEHEVRRAAGLPSDAPRASVVRCILESIAATAARAIREVASVAGTPLEELFVVGGGARVELVNRLLSDHAGLPVRVGSPEAAALGNAAVQGIGLGWFDDLEDARRWLAAGSHQHVGGTVTSEPDLT